MDKEYIFSEIRRTATANGGVAVGAQRFEQETPIRKYDWYPHFWSRWGDALREAGFQPNRMSVAYDYAFLIEKLVILSRSLGRIPIEADLLRAATADRTFPSTTAFRRLGLKEEKVARVIAFCETQRGYDDVATLWRQIGIAQQSSDSDGTDSTTPAVGYVYLLKHGSRREYKIGRTNITLRREGELGIQLPDKLQPVHYIETDDPAGVENY